jgi:hypothetical protein
MWPPLFLLIANQKPRGQSVEKLVDSGWNCKRPSTAGEMSRRLYSRE